MAPRKRTESKHTPPTSPSTTTSHTSADHHHHHPTGPSISTRARTSTASSKPPAEPEPAPKTSDKKPPVDVSPPGTRTPFTKFVYILFICLLLLFGWYIYGMVTLVERLKEEVGWWGIVVGDTGPDWRGRYGPEGVRSGDLDGSLNALADALGISPVQVASAVKPLIPQASLTSIALEVRESGRSEAVRVLVEDTTPGDRRTGMMGENEGVREEGSVFH